MEEKEEYIYKHDMDKPRLDLVPPIIIEAVGIIMTYGLKKYGEDNWRQVDCKRYKAAMMRHMCAYLRAPTEVDPESGYPHLWHAACNIAFILELERGGSGESKTST